MVETSPSPDVLKTLARSFSGTGVIALLETLEAVAVEAEIDSQAWARVMQNGSPGSVTAGTPLPDQKRG